jgi:ribonuclease T2
MPMRFAPWSAVLLALALAAPAAARHPRAHAAREAAPGEFDYYVMALSWSPTFCSTHPEEEDQCAHKGYGFVLHGLWPQYERGGGPQHCATGDEPDRRTVARALAFMPSRRLVGHEWHAHGACTGLAPQAYFELADRAFARIKPPPALQAPARDLELTAAGLRGALERANPGLADAMLSLHCSGGELVEVRICLDKDLAPRACGRRMREGCPRSGTFTVPAVR